MMFLTFHKKNITMIKKILLSNTSTHQNISHTATTQKSYHDIKVRLCSEGVTKLFPKCFDRQNSIFLNPHGKRKPAPELHLSALNFEF